MERFVTHFANDEAHISQSVLLELMTILGRYRNDLYLVGGWAPYFLLKQFQTEDNPFEHIGSIDIDLVIDFTHISEAQYSSIVESLEKREYAARKNRHGRAIPFSFERTIRDVTVAVDFLAGEYGGTKKSQRHQRVQGDFLARKARGADLLPQHHIILRLDGYLPDGSHHSCDLRLSNIVSILSMKGITIAERYKEKDAYDIYALIAHYKKGANSCYEEIAPFCRNNLVREGMQSICEKFSSQNAVGPTWAATFMEPDNPSAAKVKQTKIYRQVIPFVEKMQDFLK
jgi:hypothetical protein